jgi:diguanylate cyclase (GGDEF)-like protein
VVSRPRPTTVVTTMVIVLTAAGVGLLAAARLLPTPAPVSPQLPWPLLAALYVPCIATVLNVQIGREARSISLSEIPAVLALAFCAPADLLAAHLTGAAATYLLVRKQYRQPSKLAFNLAVAFAETCLSLVVVRLLLWGGQAADPRGWIALLAATVTGSCLAGLAVAVVIQLLENDVSLPSLVRILPNSSAQAVIIGLFGVLAVIALHAEVLSGLLLAAMTAALITAYRAYASLSDRHLTLERLYRFTQVVSSSPEMSEVLSGVLGQARDLLHAERAMITFLKSGPGNDGLEVTSGRSGGLHRGPATVLTAEPGTPVAQTLAGHAATLLPRGTRDPVLRSWLDRRQLRELLAVPLQGDSGVVAILAVADRLGEARGFDREDVRLLETVANHASIALRNGRLVDQLRHESSHDSLTGLPNRAYFQSQIDLLLSRLDEDDQLAVGILDLDNFKDVNDTLGHGHGDELLQELAQRLTFAAGDEALVARLGGDEFAVAFTCKDGATAAALASSLIAALHEPVRLGEVDVEIGGSLGVALTGTSGTQRSVLLKHADVAMYAAKQAADDVMLYDPVLDHSTPNRLAVVAQLRQAIAADLLHLHIQPQIRLATGRVAGAEALVRWTHPELGAVPPDEFIPLAERSGLIRPLTKLVLHKAVSACAAWQTHAPGVGIAVNLSVKSLGDDSLLDQVDKVLKRYKLDPQLLTLEITESSIMSDPAKTMYLLHQLRTRGIGLSIDDFGTGYSSLSYLRRLPVNEVKIDKSFVTTIERDHDNAAIARSIIDLARGLGLTVVAEGIEDAEAAAILGRLGCDYGQGYFFSRPIPVPEFVRWLSDRQQAVHPALLDR